MCRCVLRSKSYCYIMINSPTFYCWLSYSYEGTQVLVRRWGLIRLALGLGVLLKRRDGNSAAGCTCCLRHGDAMPTWLRGCCLRRGDVDHWDAVMAHSNATIAAAPPGMLDSAAGKTPRHKDRAPCVRTSDERQCIVLAYRCRGLCCAIMWVATVSMGWPAMVYAHEVTPPARAVAPGIERSSAPPAPPPVAPSPSRFRRALYDVKNTTLAIAWDAKSGCNPMVSPPHPNRRAHCIAVCCCCGGGGSEVCPRTAPGCTAVVRVVRFVRVLVAGTPRPFASAPSPSPTGRTATSPRPQSSRKQPQTQPQTVCRLTRRAQF